MILHHWLSQLAKNRLSISVNSTVLTNQELFQKLREFTLDVVFTFDSVVDEHIKVKQVATIPVLLVTTERKQSVEQALSENFIFVDWGTAINTEIANKYGDKVRPAFKLGHNYPALSMLLRHRGAAFLAEQTVREHIKQQRLFIVDAVPRYERIVYAAYSLQSHHTDLISQSLSLFEQMNEFTQPDLSIYQDSS